MRPEALNQWKILMIPYGIETASFWFVAQCFTQLRQPHCMSHGQI
jgi:hypothetical protein